MSQYSEFFLSSRSSVVQLELLQISHSSFTQTYRLVRNATNGVTVNLGDHDGVNRFNPADPNFTSGSYVHPSGALSANASYNATGYIPLRPNHTYTRTQVGFYCYYDADLNPVGYDGTTGALTFTVPGGVAFGRFSVTNSGLATYQLEEGDTATPYKVFGLATFNYRPLKISGIGTRDNLDFGIRVDLGDLGEVLPQELDAVAGDNRYEEKPRVVYRTFRSDDLTAPLFGPVVLETTSFNFNRTGSSFEARAPSLNINKTGYVYKLDRFPMLRGFL